ncbi:hypothetical protein JRO89_XS05G0051500 [Xanthoceras sorbifolium]|uniref:RING-type E3 ubiquitin transferase n=1 Tax=Xanthoceras sorbifolium TaxID=99658 RepID=A0ABQ8I0K9_9ROSI|nr:hypothetical protein JRO89_XS05G0051500 [Xanthoceras sorbifolium]
MSFHTGPDRLTVEVSQPYDSIEVWQPYDHLYSSETSLSPPHTRVACRIFFKHSRQFIDCLPDGSTNFLGSGPASRQQRSCSFDLCSFLKELIPSHVTLWENLSSLGIDGEAVHGLIQHIYLQGREVLASKRESNMGQRVIPLHVEISKVQLVWVHYDRYLAHREMMESMEEFERRNYGMVPASESSLKRMLKRVRVVGDEESDGGNKESKKKRRSESENCSICLEEVEVGSYGTSMPCSHVFHGDCIVEWLKQSHYCPVCRYEMPTN